MMTWKSGISKMERIDALLMFAGGSQRDEKESVVLELYRCRVLTGRLTLSVDDY